MNDNPFKKKTGNTPLEQTWEELLGPEDRNLLERMVSTSVEDPPQLLSPIDESAMDNLEKEQEAHKLLNEAAQLYQILEPEHRAKAASILALYSKRTGAAHQDWIDLAEENLKSNSSGDSETIVNLIDTYIEKGNWEAAQQAASNRLRLSLPKAKAISIHLAKKAAAQGQIEHALQASHFQVPLHATDALFKAAVVAHQNGQDPQPYRARAHELQEQSTKAGLQDEITQHIYALQSLRAQAIIDKAPVSDQQLNLDIKIENGLSKAEALKARILLLSELGRFSRVGNMLRGLDKIDDIFDELLENRKLESALQLEDLARREGKSDHKTTKKMVDALLKAGEFKTVYDLSMTRSDPVAIEIQSDIIRRAPADDSVRAQIQQRFERMYAFTSTDRLQSATNDAGFALTGGLDATPRGRAFIDQDKKLHLEDIWLLFRNSRAVAPYTEDIVYQLIQNKQWDALFTYARDPNNRNLGRMQGGVFSDVVLEILEGAAKQAAHDFKAAHAT